MNNFLPYLRKISAEYNVDPDLVKHVIQQESAWNPAAKSSAGAIGLMQLMPETARELGVDPNDAFDNIRGGVKYLSQQLKAHDNNLPLALAAYNAGPGNVQKYDGIPPFPETQKYVNTIMNNYNKSKQNNQNDIQQTAMFEPGFFSKPYQIQDQSQDVEINNQQEQFAQTQSNEMFEPGFFSKPYEIPQQEYDQIPQKNDGFNEQFAQTQQEQHANEANNGKISLGDNFLNEVGNWAKRFPGRVLDNIAQKHRGAVQTLGHGLEYVTDKLGFDNQRFVDTRKNIDRDIYENQLRYNLEREKNGETGFDGAQMLGGMLHDAAMTAPLIGALPLKTASKIGTSIGAGVASGGSEPVIGENVDSDQYWNEKKKQGLIGALGGAGGHVLGKTIGRIYSPTRAVPDSGRQQGIKAADKLGLKYSVAEKTANHTQNQVQANAERLPFIGDGFQKIRDDNAVKMNQAAIKSMGLDNTNKTHITDDVFAEAADRFKREYDELTAGRTIRFDENFIKRINDIEHNNQLAGGHANKKLSREIKNILKDVKVGEEMPADRYFAVREAIENKARGAYMRGEPQLAKGLKDIRKTYDLAAKESLTPEQQAKWDELDKQYANFKILQKGKVVDDGNVSPAKLKNYYTQKMGEGFKRGSIQSPLVDIAHAGSILKQTIPNSGTPERMLAQNMVKGMLGAGAIGSGVTFAPVGAPASALGYWLAAKKLPGLLTSDYIKNVKPNATKIGGLLGKAGALSGAEFGHTQNRSILPIPQRKPKR